MPAYAAAGAEYGFSVLSVVELEAS